jgi:hypothetical protein
MGKYRFCFHAKSAIITWRTIAIPPRCSQPSIRAAAMFTALVWIFIVLVAGMGLSELAGIIVLEIVEMMKRRRS